MKILARCPELKVRVDQSFDCSCLSPSGGCLSHLLPPSLASRSNTPHLIIFPQSQARRFPLLSPPGSHFLPLFPLSGILSLLPSLIFHLPAWDFSSLCVALLSGIFSLQTSPQPPPLAHSLSPRFPLSVVQIFYFSFHHFTCSLHPSLCLPPPLLRSL